LIKLLSKSRQWRWNRPKPKFGPAASESGAARNATQVPGFARCITLLQGTSISAKQRRPQVPTRRQATRPLNRRGLTSRCLVTQRIGAPQLSFSSGSRFPGAGVDEANAIATTFWRRRSNLCSCSPAQLPASRTTIHHIRTTVLPHILRTPARPQTRTAQACTLCGSGCYPHTPACPLPARHQ
jgi:hypothetical protein